MHHFFGKDLIIDKNLNKIDNFKQKIRDLGFNFILNPVFVNQIHSSKVLVIDSVGTDYSSSPLIKADSIVTNLKKLPICVVTADCVPIIFFDKKSGVIAVCHAGWRGAFSDIIDSTISQMQNLGSKNSDISAIIGPAIRQNSYEVSEDFYLNFVKKNQNNKIFFIKKTSEQTSNIKYLFDLPAFCYKKLKNNKIKNISDLEIDTYNNKKNFFSYRRSFHEDKQDCGRNVSVVMQS